MSDRITSDTRSPTSFWSRLLVLAGMAMVLVSCGGPNLIDRISSPRWGLCGTLVIILDIVALVDLIGDDGRSTGNKVLWSLAIVFFPVGGVLLYFIFGRD